MAYFGEYTSGVRGVLLPEWAVESPFQSTGHHQVNRKVQFNIPGVITGHSMVTLKGQHSLHPSSAIGPVRLRMDIPLNDMFATHSFGMGSSNFCLTVLTR